MERRISQPEYKITNPDNHEAARIIKEQGKSPKRIIEQVVKDIESGKIISSTPICPFHLLEAGNIDILLGFMDNLQRQGPGNMTELIISSDQ